MTANYKSRKNNVTSILSHKTTTTCQVELQLWKTFGQNVALTFPHMHYSNNNNMWRATRCRQWWKLPGRVSFFDRKTFLFLPWRKRMLHIVTPSPPDDIYPTSFDWYPVCCHTICTGLAATGQQRISVSNEAIDGNHQTLWEFKKINK